MKIGDQILLVNPIDLVSSIYLDEAYMRLEPTSKDRPGYFIVEVEKKAYCYHWSLSHSTLDFYSEIRFAQEEYASKIFEVVSRLHQAVQSGGELAYDKLDVDKDNIASCYKQILVKCTWPSDIRKTAKDIQVEEFRFDIIPGNEGENFTIGIGDRSYSTWFSHWDGDLERIRHQFESFTFEQEAEVKITFDTSETIIKMEEVSIIDQINESGKGFNFKYKDYVLVKIIPNGFVAQPILIGYCIKDQVLRRLYEGLLRMALDHPRVGYDYVPGMLDAYNMIKSPIIEDYILGRTVYDRNFSYAIRQVIVKHIITIHPDYDQLFYDEEGCLGMIDENGTIDFVYDRKNQPIAVKDFYTWQSKINPIVIESETGHPYSMDWEEYHAQGLKLAHELRKILSPDFDLWYEAPFEDKSGIIKRSHLILESPIPPKKRKT